MMNAHSSKATKLIDESDLSNIKYADALNACLQVSQSGHLVLNHQPIAFSTEREWTKDMIRKTEFYIPSMFSWAKYKSGSLFNKGINKRLYEKILSDSKARGEVASAREGEEDIVGEEDSISQDEEVKLEDIPRIIEEEKKEENEQPEISGPSAPPGDIEKPGEIDNRWSYWEWSNLWLWAKSGDWDKIKRTANYWTALFNVTGPYGRPIDAPFVQDIQNFIPVDPPEELPEITGGDILSENANNGYALWILGCRVAFKSYEIDPDSQMPRTLTTFLDYKMTEVVSQLSNFRSQMQSIINSDSPIGHGNAVSRRGMNITYKDLYSIQRDGQGDWIGTENGVKVNYEDYLGVPFKRDKNERLIPMTLEGVDNYHAGFWGFVQVGVYKHGWSAMELIYTGIKKYGLTLNSLLKYFPTNAMLNFVGACVYEDTQCTLDPWRAASHLLGVSIETPLSGSKHRIISYVGVCLNTPNFTPDNPPEPMPGLPLTENLQRKIAWMTDNMINNDTSSTMAINQNVALKFGTPQSTLKIAEYAPVSQLYPKLETQDPSRLFSKIKERIPITLSGAKEPVIKETTSKEYYQLAPDITLTDTKKSIASDTDNGSELESDSELSEDEDAVKRDKAKSMAEAILGRLKDKEQQA